MRNIKIKPNDPCPCGRKRPNGKPMKYKKCCLNKKPREQAIYFRRGINDDMSGITIDSNSGKILLHLSTGETKESDMVFSMTHYKKDNYGKNVKLMILPDGTSSGHDGPFKNIKPLSIHEGIALGHEGPFNLMDYLDRFDFVFCADTSTDKISGEDISVGVYIELFVKKRQQAEGDLSIPISKRRVLFFKEIPGGAAEKFTWFQLLKNVLAANNDKDIKIALITDHQDNWGDIQSRKMPVYGDFYLPDGVTLIYASDAANETILNTAIRECDKYGQQIIKELKNGNGVVIGGENIPIDKIPRGR